MSPIKIVERTKNLAITDFLTQNVTCTASQKGEGVGLADFEGFTLIGEYVVPPQRRIALGIRPDILNPNSGGLFHIELHDAADANVEGEFKIVFRSASGLRKATIIRRHSNAMYVTTPTDRSKQALIKLGFNIPIIWCREDSVIQLLFKPNVDSSVIKYNSVNNVFYMDVTVQYPLEGTQEFI
jgi:hypothetical protein